MRMDEEMNRRLENWARWSAFRTDGGRPASGSATERVDCAGWDAPTVIPTSDAEAEETDRGVRRMELRLRGALVAWYLGGGGVVQRCKRVGCSETELRTRVALGQRALDQWLADRRAAADAERQRVEALQRLVRAGVLRTVGNR